MKANKLFFLLLFMPKLYADPIVTFFFQDYPTQELANYTLAKMKKPQAIAKKALQGIGAQNPRAGIFSTYYGFLGISNYVGQTSFPRKQSKNSLVVYITNKFTPIMMFQNTVSHWQLVPGVPAEAYYFNLEENPETKLLVWNVSKAPVDPKGNIPAEGSLLILAKPKNLFVPLGASLASQDANLKLPDMYAKKGIATNRNALYILNMNFLFRPVEQQFKVDKKRFGSLVKE